MATKTENFQASVDFDRRSSDSQTQVNTVDALNAKNERKQNGGPGSMRSGSIPGSGSPPVERKSRFAAFGRLFKPWKWKRKKKSEKIEKVAGDLERNLSFRSNREDLIRRGILKPDELKEEGQTENGQSDNQVEVLTTVPESDTVKEDKYEIPTANGSTPVASATGHGDGPCTNSHEINNIHKSGGGQRDSRSMAQKSLSQIDSQEAASDRLGTMRPTSIPPASPAARDIPRDQAKDTPQHQNPTVMAFKVLPPLPPQHKFHNYEEVVQRKEEANSPYPPSYDSVQHEQYDNVPTNHMKHRGGPASGRPTATYPPPGSPRVQQQTDYHAHTMSTPKGNVQRPFSYTNHMLPPGSPTQPLSHLPYQVVDTSRIEEILAREPDLSLMPKKSALKHSAGPKVAPKPKMKARMVKMARIESDKENIPENDDSDDGEIKYRDDDETGWASKVARKDSLARFLSNRPPKAELESRNILPVKTDQERLAEREAVGHKLIRRLSLRPTAEELEAKNILHKKSLEEFQKEKEEKKKYLTRKLSFRPTIDELKERKIIKFSDYVEFTECHEYDRRADKPWTRLTPKDKAAIRKELNEYKSSEMPVHENSRHLTRFHRP